MVAVAFLRRNTLRTSLDLKTDDDSAAVTGEVVTDAALREDARS